MREHREHPFGTPDVPDIVRPGDWLEIKDDTGFVSYVLVVKVLKTFEGEWDYCPGAESWSIRYLGIGYLRQEEKLSSADCGGINQIVAINGELLPLYKFSRSDKLRVIQNPGYLVTRSASNLIRRMNTPKQMFLFA